MRPRLRPLVFGVVIALGLAGCGGGGDDQATPSQASCPEPARPTGSVRFLIAENFWADWKPYQSTAQSQARLDRMLYDYLVAFPDGDLSQPKPMLATAWRQVDDRTWEFDLRQNVTFHEGQPFTAADVKASVEQASGATKVKTVTAQNWVPTRVEAVSDHTVRLRSDKPFAPLLAQLGDTPIVSAAWLQGDPDRLAKQPNGTGPFRLTGDAPTRKAMSANPGYWQKPAGIQDLVWEFIQDPQTRLNALLAGEAQAIDRVPPEHLKLVQGSDKLAATSVTGIESVNLWVRPGRLKLWDSNQRFRQAVNWSVDREALVKNLVQGSSVAAQSFLPSKAQGFEAQSARYTFDEAKAKAALTAAGVPDGGPEFELWVATGFLPRAKEVVEVIAENMRKIGLKPKIVTSDVAGMIDDIFSDDGTGAMYHLSWSSNGDPHQHMQVYASPFVWNYGDKTIDRMVQQGLVTTGQAERAEVYNGLQRYMWEQMPHVPLYNSDFTVAHSASLQGMTILPNFSVSFYRARLCS
jgi:peptide/nickel transport system substrate-binding protein